MSYDIKHQDIMFDKIKEKETVEETVEETQKIIFGNLVLDIRNQDVYTFDKCPVEKRDIE